MDAGEARGGQPGRQHFLCVLHQYPHVAQALPFDAQQAVSNPRWVYFDADEVGVRCGRCHGEQGIAVAEADFQHPWRVAAEHGLQVKAAGTVWQSKARQQLAKGPLLPGGQSSGPPDKAADRAPLQLVTSHQPAPGGRAASSRKRRIPPVAG